MLLMTPLQCAYMLERKKRNGSMGVPCHVYMEFRARQVDEKALKAAWLELFRVHPIMGAKCDDCGGLYITKWIDKQYYRTYREWDAAGFEKYNIRDKISHQTLDVENGIACQLHVIKSCGSIYRIGFELDLVICDVHSFQVILNDLAEFYINIRSGEVILREPDAEFQLTSTTDRKVIIAARKYWKVRMGNEYIGFPFKLKKNLDELSSYRYSNFQAEIKEKEYQKISAVAAYQGISIDEYLLMVFCYVIIKETGKNRILVNYPFFERNLKNANAVGDFTKSIIFRCESEKSFKTFFTAMHQSLKEDLSHDCLDGLAVQKIIKEMTDKKYPVPLVFSPSMAIPIVTDKFTNNIGKLEYIISQTPGVWLDAQTYRKDDGLLLTWVILKELLDEIEIEKLFNSYVKALIRFTNIENWENENDDK